MSPISVLVVDDEPSLLEGLQVFLEDEGYAVHLSTDGDNALEVFRKIVPWIVITDLRMPGLSGIEMIRRIKDINQDTIIIVLTGFGSMEAAVESIRLDVFDFLNKPIDIDILKNTLDRAGKSIEEIQQAESETNMLREQLALAKSHIQIQQKSLKEQEAQAAVERSMAGMLHNLNNALNYIMGQSQIFQLVYPEIDVFKKIDRQACRMAQIIWSFIRKIRGSENRQEEWLDLNQILVEGVKFLETHPSFHGHLETKWRLADRLPLFKGNAEDFAQIFENLLFNAAEAMDGQVVKRLVLETVYDDAEICVSIKDNGPGIPRELHDRIFEPFFTTKTVKPGICGNFGTGLGLYSCRQIIQEYGGTIEASSEPGQSATFKIHLPKNS